MAVWRTNASSPLSGGRSCVAWLKCCHARTLEGAARKKAERRKGKGKRKHGSKGKGKDHTTTESTDDDPTDTDTAHEHRPCGRGGGTSSRGGGNVSSDDNKTSTAVTLKGGPVARPARRSEATAPVAVRLAVALAGRTAVAAPARPRPALVTVAPAVR